MTSSGIAPANAYKILIGNAAGKNSLRRPGTWAVSTGWDFEEV
jgi:hypothetical protein